MTSENQKLLFSFSSLTNSISSIYWHLMTHDGTKIIKNSKQQHFIRNPKQNMKHAWKQEVTNNLSSMVPLFTSKYCVHQATEKENRVALHSLFVSLVYCGWKYGSLVYYERKILLDDCWFDWTSDNKWPIAFYRYAKAQRRKQRHTQQGASSSSSPFLFRRNGKRFCHKFY
jgi:hypothetical protein